MKIIGITGGIGTGKTTVCQILQRLGCAVFNADDAARTIQETDPTVISNIKALFGDSIYDVSGKLDRKRVGEIVFKDKTKLAELNAAVHPAVFRAFDATKAQAEKSGVDVLIKEAAIMFESGSDAGVDAVIVVAADLEIRVSRVISRSGLERDEVLKRIANQFPQETLIAKADAVIWNNGSRADLEGEVQKALHQVHSSFNFSTMTTLTDTEKPLLEKESEIFFHTYGRLPLEISHGEGVYLFTKDGKRYLDMIAGIGVNALGYGNARVIQAIETQIRKYIHVSNLFVPEMQMRLAEKLLEQSGFSKVFFANSGAEAIEGAMKLSRKWASKISKEKNQLLSLTNGFHGRTYGAVTLTAKPKYHEGYEPLLPGTGYIEFNDVADLESKVSDNTCAVFVEAIQGEGGVCAVSETFAGKLKALRTKHNFLIVADEVQAGIGRTGKFFAFEHLNLEPDVICSAKPLGGGLPIGAVIGTEKVAEVFTKGVHGTTFGGNPVACAAGVALIDELLEKNLMQNAVDVGAFMKAELVKMQARHIQIVRIRQYGLMIGISTSRDATYYVEKALERGVILNATSGNVIRLLPPLTLTKAQATECLEVLNDIFAKEFTA